METTAPPTVTRVSDGRQGARRRSAPRRLLGFAAWASTGFGLLGTFRDRAGAVRDEVIVYSVQSSFFLWPLVALGFVGAACVHRWPATAGVWGWVYVATLTLTFVTVMFDAGARKMVVWLGAFALLWVSSKYVEDLRHVPVLSPVVAHLRGLHPQLDPGTATVLSWLLLVPWVGTLLHSFGAGRKRFSPNGIEEWFLGEGYELTDRHGLKFRARYRDLFETVLGLGAGDLEAIDGHQRVVKRWENVLMLWFHWRRLDTILHQRSLVVDKDEGARG